MADSTTELVVVVGTTNPTKINAVKEVLPKVFPQYASHKVLGVSVRYFLIFAPLSPLKALLYQKMTNI